MFGVGPAFFNTQAGPSGPAFWSNTSTNPNTYDSYNNASVVDASNNIITFGGDSDEFNNPFLIVTKWNSTTGAITWQIKIDKLAPVNFESADLITLDASGNIYLYTTCYLTGVNTNYLNVYKLSSSGSLLWVKSITAVSDQYYLVAYDMLTLSDGILVSFSYVPISASEVPRGRLVKIDFDGTLVWNSGIETDYTSNQTMSRNVGIGVDSTGNLYSFTSGYDAVAFLTKYNSSGTPQWSKKIDVPGWFYGYGTVNVTSAGDIIVGSAQVFFKFDSSGNLVWTKYDNNGEIYPTCAVLDGDLLYYVDTNGNFGCFNTFTATSEFVFNCYNDNAGTIQSFYNETGHRALSVGSNFISWGAWDYSSATTLKIPKDMTGAPNGLYTLENGVVMVPITIDLVDTAYTVSSWPITIISADVTIDAKSTTSSSYVTANVEGALIARPLAPVASFTVSPLSGYIPLSFTLTDTSTNSPTSWNWYFSGEYDYQNSTLQNPIINWTTPGNIYVSLNVTNVGGSNSTSTYVDALSNFQEVWNASTNSPSLQNGVGTINFVYIVGTAGTVDFGAGAITFAVGDLVVYNGSVWQKFAAGTSNPSLNYKAAYNTIDALPTIADNTGIPGDYYVVAGDVTRDFGSGNITLTAGDYLIMNKNKVWQRLPAYSAGIGQPLTYTTTSVSSGSITLAGVNQIVLNPGDGIHQYTLTSGGGAGWTYPSIGIWTVKIFGQMTAFNCPSASVASVNTFGNLGLERIRFTSSSNSLTSIPSILPSTVTHLDETFRLTTNANSLTMMQSWDTKNVTSMIATFMNASGFNLNIGSWNTGNVTNMTQMFENATSFNKDLSGWDVHLIPTKPSDFATGCPINNTAFEPVWGTTGV